jgi:uncharacterized membrane protein YccC
MQSAYPWPRAISSGLSSFIPIAAGILTGQFAAGLLAAMGGFAYLYTSNEPYSRRAVKLLAVIVGFALCFGVGSMASAISVWVAALVIGAVSFASVFVCEALDIASPSALFFIYLCAIGTNLPAAEPSALIGHVLLIFLGGVPSWLVSMSGWLLDPHGPETKAVGGSYRALAACLAAFGTDQLHAAQHRAAVALRSAEKVLSASGVPRRRPGDFFRLLRLNQQAEAVFLATAARTAETGDPMDPKLPAAVRALADAVGDPDRAASLVIPRPARQTAAIATLHNLLVEAVAMAGDENPDTAPRPRARPRSLRNALKGALNPTSLIVPRALRFAAVLLAAHLTAYFWRTPRPYWVVLSAAAVMMGPTVTATLHRALQRSAGTVAGALAAGVILLLQPAPWVIALAVAIFQACSQLMGVRNYALVVAFYTPLGLLIAHGSHPELTTQYLIEARLIDIFLGCAIGLAGTLLFDQGSSSKRLPLVLSDTLRREGRLLEAILAESGPDGLPERNHLRAALIHLRIVYDKATGELIGDRARVEALWPAVIAVQRLGFFLSALTDEERRQRISRESLAKVKELFDALASAVEAGHPPGVEPPPVIPEYPVIGQELHEISQGLQVLQA